MLQYNKILAKNVQLRLQLEEMMKVKEEFIRNLKQLQNERSQVRLTVDRLYEENTALFLQREEFRLVSQNIMIALSIGILKIVFSGRW
jgi:predicted nuclease with TOPRIM domain